MTYYLDLTPECRTRVEQQGYLIPDELELDEVVPANEDTEFLPDWDHVLAIINCADAQSHYNSIILYDDQRLLKVRPTPNRLLKRLRKHFPMDYYNDIRHTMAKALKMKRGVPYVCRDFWLMPAGPVVVTNRSWFRWQYKRDSWDFPDNCSRVIVDHHLVLQWPMSRRSVEFRQELCKAIAGFIKQQTALICPTFDMADLGEHHSEETLKKLMIKIEKYKRGLILGKVGFMECTDEVDDDLNHYRYGQLPETEF